MKTRYSAYALIGLASLSLLGKVNASDDSVIKAKSCPQGYYPNVPFNATQSACIKCTKDNKHLNCNSDVNPLLQHQASDKGSIKQLNDQPTNDQGDNSTLGIILTAVGFVGVAVAAVVLFITGYRQYQQKGKTEAEPADVPSKITDISPDNFGQNMPQYKLHTSSGNELPLNKAGESGSSIGPEMKPRASIKQDAKLGADHNDMLRPRSKKRKSFSTGIYDRAEVDITAIRPISTSTHSLSTVDIVIDDEDLSADDEELWTELQLH